MRSARVLLGALALGVLFTSGFALAAGATVSLTAEGPQPETVTVDWGDTVVFSNGDTVDRGVMSQRAGFESGVITPGGSYEFRFDARAGRYGFIETGTRPTFSGVVVVTAAGKVTLTASKKIAPYKASITLSGRSTYAGTPVVIQLRPAGASGDWTTMLDLTAAANGTYSGTIRLTAGGRVRALVAAGQVSSDFADLAVLPSVRARVSRTRVKKGEKVVVTGRVIPASAAASVDLEERREDRSNWLRKATKTVSKNGTVTFVVQASGGRNHLRLALKRGALEPGFVAAVSRPMLVVGT